MEDRGIISHDIDIVMWEYSGISPSEKIKAFMSLFKQLQIHLWCAQNDSIIFVSRDFLLMLKFLFTKLLLQLWSVVSLCHWSRDRYKSIVLFFISQWLRPAMFCRNLFVIFILLKYPTILETFYMMSFNHTADFYQIWRFSATRWQA